MPYRIRFWSYIAACAVVAFFIAALLEPLGGWVALGLIVALPYLTIMIGRRLFGREKL